MSIHVYEKRGGERVGRGRRKEGIAELLKTGVTKLQHYSNPWLLEIVHGAEENSDCVVFVSEHVLGTLSTVLSSQQPRDQHGNCLAPSFYFYFLRDLLNIRPGKPEQQSGE